MKTWEDVKSVDDLIIEPEREIIKKIEEELKIRCPFLKKLGKYFYYCSGGVPEDIKLEFEPFNPIIMAKQELAQLQLHCMDRYETCCCYNGSLPFPGSSVTKK